MLHKKHTEFEIAGHVSNILINRFFEVFNFSAPLYNMIIDYDAFYDNAEIKVEIYLNEDA